MTCHGTDCVLPSHHRKHTPCLLVFWQSFYLSSVYFYNVTVFSYGSNPSLLQPNEKRSSQCRVTQTFPIHPHGNREGYPQPVWCLELTRHRVPKALAYRSRECVLGEIRPSRFGNTAGGLVGRNDIRAPENRDWQDGRERCTEPDICCGIPELRLRSVFGTQLSGIWFALCPIHFSPSISALFTPWTVMFPFIFGKWFVPILEYMFCSFGTVNRLSVTSCDIWKYTRPVWYWCVQSALFSNGLSA